MRECKWKQEAKAIRTSPSTQEADTTSTISRVVFFAFLHLFFIFLNKTRFRRFAFHAVNTFISRFFYAWLLFFFSGEKIEAKEKVRSTSNSHPTIPKKKRRKKVHHQEISLELRHNDHGLEHMNEMGS